MKVIDPFGNEKDYTPDKIVDSVMRSGFDKKTANEIEEQVRERVDDRMSTKQLYQIVYEEMQEFNAVYARRYRLREAIGSLDTNFHEFEKYMTRVLALDGWDTEWSPRPLPQGECTTHEIDILAEQNGERIAVECKHHYHYHRITGLDVAMLQWAILQDLQKGHEIGLKDAVDVDGAWVIVNTKLSQHAKNYAECKGINMTAWDYPDGGSLREIVERNNAYPITLLDLRPHTKKELSKKDVLTLQGLINIDEGTRRNLNIPHSEFESLVAEAKDCIND